MHTIPTLEELVALRHPAAKDSRRAEFLDAARRELAFMERYGVWAAAKDSDGYPRRLQVCDDAPAVLFGMGEAAAACAQRTVAIVGTRHCTPYGADFTRRLVADLAEAVDGLTIVSGLAYGIDIEAHRAALRAGVPTVAVLAHGLNTIYPAEHRTDATRIVADGGALLTEYTSQDATHRGNFLARNRIVAALADVTVVVESDMRGGALSTARRARDYGRPVMALPGRVSDRYSAGCLDLLVRGVAKPLRDADDLIAALRWPASKKGAVQQELAFDTPVDSRFTPVIELIKLHPEATVNDMCADLGMDYATLSVLLFEMEMADIIMPLPGGKVALTAKSK